MRPVGSTKERQPIFKEEFDKLITLTKKDKLIQRTTKLKLLRAYTLLYLTGCRVSEIVGFTCKDIDTIIANKTISLSNDTKTKKPRALFFNDEGISMLLKLSYIDCPKDTQILFYSNSNSCHMDPAVFTRIINTNLMMSLGDLYTTHSFRAGYITRIVEATGNIEIARSLVGHRSLKTTVGYLSATPKQKQNAIDLLFPTSEIRDAHDA